MAGASDLSIVSIPLDVVLTDFPVQIGKRQITVGRMDGTWVVKFGSVQSVGATVDRPFQITDCREIIDRIYVTTTVPVPGGRVELWCTNPDETGVATT